MAAFGLYTHIQSNRRRSVALLIGLFFLVYVMAFAGALIGEALTRDAPLDFIVRAAARDFLYSLPFVTIGTALVDFHRLQVPPIDDRCGHRRARGDPAGAAAPL